MKSKKKQRSQKALQIQLSFARGVRKGRKLGFEDGWDSAMHERNKGDEAILKGLKEQTAIPEAQLPKEAVSMETTTVEEQLAVISRPGLSSEVTRRLMQPISFN